MVQVAVAQSIVEDVRSGLGAEADGVDLLALDPPAGGADLSEVAAGIRWDVDDDGFRTLLDSAPHLRWLHSPGAGVEGWPLDEIAARGITLTNAAGVFAIPIAEWVLTAMLNAAKSSYAVRAAQDDRRWATDIATEELYGKTLLVLGTGGIGAEVIKRASAFGMSIVGANRSGREIPGTDRTVQGEAWRDVLPEADFVVSTLPSTAATQQMFGAAELAACRDTAWLINVGRGATIDEDALIRALQAGTLGGAALDAWATEPLPADSPAWSLPNLVVSPHMSGSTPQGRDRGLALFVDNLRRFARGDELTNVVDLSAGY